MTMLLHTFCRDIVLPDQDIIIDWQAGGILLKGQKSSIGTGEVKADWKDGLKPCVTGSQLQHQATS